MKNEKSIVPHPKIPHIHFCILGLHYRNPHSHSTYEILYVLEGKTTYRTPTTTIELHKGDILLTNANEVHELSSRQNTCLLLCMQISSVFCQTYFPDLRAVVFQAHLITSMLTSQERLNFLDSLFSAAESYWKAEPLYAYFCVAKVCMMLNTLLSNIPYQLISASEYAMQAQTTTRLNQIESFIEEHYSEDRLLQKLAAHLGFTTSYMSHFFKDNFHITFQEYLMRHRLEKAIQMLCSSDIPILDICNECGFADYRQINRYCQAEFGCSARDCRKINLNEKSHNCITPPHPLMEQRTFSDAESLEYFHLHHIMDSLRTSNN